MVCLCSPSCICIVACGWLKCFIAAKGKIETIRKKYKEKNIFEERCCFIYIFTLQQIWVVIFNISSIRLRTWSLHGLAIKTKLICKISIHSLCSDFKSVSVFNMSLNICFFLFFSLNCWYKLQSEELAIPLIFLFCCVHSPFHWSPREAGIKKCPTATRGCQRFLFLFTMNNQPNNKVYKVSKELISKNLCAYFLKG